jgi:peptidoglycan/LPS O-acetylase OafA/YrhL
MDERTSNWAGRFSRITSGGNFIPEIDGLRFLAISSVLLFHASYALLRAYSWNLGPVERVVSNLFARGALGVELFFVISGFILAVPFARHFVEGGKPVDLGRYYLRRVTRLEPPYILTLILFYTAAWISHDPAMQGRLLPTFLVRLFYLHGLIYRDAPALNGVTWSLEIEVQFYLIMPVLAQIFRLPAAWRRVILFLGVLLVPFVPREGILLFSVVSQLALFLAGFLFADIYLEMRRKGITASERYDWAALAVFIFVLVFPFLMQAAGMMRPFSGSDDVDFAMSVLRHMLPVIILAFLLLMFQGMWLRRFFSLKPVYLIGGMCYSIYLLHYPFISTASRLLARRLPGMHYLPALTVMAMFWLPVVLGISAIFFAYIERPCMDHDWPKKLWARVRGRSK